MSYHGPFSFIPRPKVMPLDETAMSSAPRPERALDLDDARKRAGISLDEIAGTTKISLRFLKAIEAEEFEKLPGGIFTTSYLRQYAVAIGYDAEALVAHYGRKTNPQAAVAPAAKARERRQQPAGPVAEDGASVAVGNWPHPHRPQYSPQQISHPAFALFPILSSGRVDMQVRKAMSSDSSMSSNR